GINAIPAVAFRRHVVSARGYEGAGIRIGKGTGPAPDQGNRRGQHSGVGVLCRSGAARIEPPTAALVLCQARRHARSSPGTATGPLCGAGWLLGLMFFSCLLYKPGRNDVILWITGKT